MNNIEYIKNDFDQLQSADATVAWQAIRKKAFDAFNRIGIPM